jgi:L-rhamnose mutarotase
MSKRYCLTLDLKDDADLIREYEDHHKAVWPEIIKSIKDSGITDMEIYRLENRLCMIMEVDKDFSFEKKQQLDEDNAKVQEWEELMWKYQQPLAIAAEGEKWMLMKNVFTLKDF